MTIQNVIQEQIHSSDINYKTWKTLTNTSVFTSNKQMDNRTQKKTIAAENIIISNFEHFADKFWAKNINIFCDLE